MKYLLPYYTSSYLTFQHFQYKKSDETRRYLRGVSCPSGRAALPPSLHSDEKPIVWQSLCGLQLVAAFSKHDLLPQGTTKGNYKIKCGIFIESIC